MKIIENKKFDEERALYASRGVHLKSCAFDGPADGESALKESRDITVEDTYCNLRYPFWHDKTLVIKRTEMTPLCRAALWYSEDIVIEDTKLHGIKALRECKNVEIRRSSIDSEEFGWSSVGVTMEHTKANSVYFMMRAEDLTFKNVSFTGKYSFQYIKNAVFEDCDFDTKDAFWHAENVTVKNCKIKGEYLAWYCKNVTFEHCVISGTQPLCYCEGLRLIDCEMYGADFAFEKSAVEATVTTPLISIKNPRAGKICAPSVGQIIIDDENANGEVVVGGAL